MAKIRVSRFGWVCIGASALGLLGFAALHQRQSRLSGAVAIVSEGPKIEAFLHNPGLSFVQGYVRFAQDLPDDVIFGLDQELLDGVRQPLYVKGGDWMSLVGIQRTGAVWVATGTNSTDQGTPSKDRNWKIRDFGQPLQPDVWYKVRIEADYKSRQFRSVSISGPGLQRTIDLSGEKLDFPNAMPFSDRAMTYYGFAMRGRGMITKPGGTPVVYFDDMSGGPIVNGVDQVAFSSGFEEPDPIGVQPVTLPIIDLGKYQQGRWYLERDESHFSRARVSFARTGTSVGVASADLDSK